jgi:hypothetical protein
MGSTAEAHDSGSSSSLRAPAAGERRPHLRAVGSNWTES